MSVVSLAYAENPNEQIVVKFNQLLEQLWRPRPSSYSFQVEGVIYAVQSTPCDDGVHLSITAEIGTMPYTAESAPRRQMLKRILESSERLKVASLKVNDKGLIVLQSELAIVPEHAPEMSFARLVVFINQVQPYIKLIGSYL